MGQTGTSPDHVGEGFVHGTRQRPEAWSFLTLNEAMHGQLQVWKPDRGTVVRGTPQRRGPKPLLHRGHRVVPSALDRRRGPWLQGAQHGACCPELIEQVDVADADGGCLRPDEQHIVTVQRATSNRELHPMREAKRFRTVRVLNQRGEGAPGPEGAHQNVVGGPVEFREEPPSVPVCARRLNGRALERDPPTAVGRGQQGLDAARQDRDRPPRRGDRPFGILRQEARRPRGEHDGTRKAPRVNPALAVRIPQGQGRARRNVMGVSDRVGDALGRAVDQRMLREVMAHEVRPQHMAIIMDGNRRFAFKNRLTSGVGHRIGKAKLEEVLDWVLELNIPWFTVYALSTENLNRPQAELDALFDLYIEGLNDIAEDPRIHANHVRVQIIGRRDLLPARVIEAIDHAEGRTAGYDRFVFSVCLAYGSREEILDAIRAIAEDHAKGELALEAIDEAAVSDRLYTADMPDPDLVIRTSGEERISNFLLWQMAYAELYFTDVYWPSFSKRELLKAIKAFQQRKRRYGA